jgi:TRAP-type C4-dicarboxylate transport system permease small subunit
VTGPRPLPIRAVGAVMAAVKAAMLVAFVAMIALTLVQVANRFAIGAPIFWTEELIVLLLVWSVMLGLPVQLWQHEEIRVDVWPARTAWLQRAKLHLAGALSILFCAILLVAGWRYAQRGLPVTSPALGLSRFWFFVPIPLCAGLAALALLARPAAPTHAAGESTPVGVGLDT